MWILTDGDCGGGNELHGEWTADKDGRGIVEQRRTQSHGPDQPRYKVIEATWYLVKCADCEVTVLYKIVVYFVLNKRTNEMLNVTDKNSNVDNDIHEHVSVRSLQQYTLNNTNSAQLVLRWHR